MVLKRKAMREYSKDLKILHGVFDERTLMTLYKILDRNRIYVESLVKEGKESVVLLGKNNEGSYFAIKVFRKEASNFKSMWKYLIGDPRFSSLRKNRGRVVEEWVKREFRNLRTAFDGGVDCPRPVDYMRNVLIMDFIGEGKESAPMLINTIPEKPEGIYKRILSNMEKLAKSGLVHGDLSAYNVLYPGRPVLIDFSHGTTRKSPLFEDLLRRDIKNINSYFSKYIAVKTEEKLFNELIKHIRAKRE